MTSTTKTISPNVTLIESYEDVEDFFRWLSKDRSVLGFDTETEGLSFITDKIRLIQFGDREEAWAMSWDLWKGVALEVFKKYDGPLVGHNVKFDVNMIEHQAGVRLPRKNIHDTLVMSRLCNHNVRSHGLKNLVRVHVDPRLTIGEQLLDEAKKKNGWDWKDIPIDFEAYWFYGGLDTSMTAILYDMYMEKIVDEGLKDVYDLEMQVLLICADWEQRGIKVDLEYSQQKYEELLKNADKLKAFCKDEYGVLPGSNKAVTDRLVSDGVPLHARTEKGALKIDKDVLEEFKGTHPLIDAVKNYKDSIKIGNTYFKNFLEENRHKRIHCDIDPTKAITGRMSIKNPALQTLPRGDLVRRAFLPNDGCFWQSIDYSAVELRIACSLANEENMINLFNEGADLHSYFAKKIYATEDITKEQRQIAKNANFARIYGSGPKKYSETAHIPIEEAKKVYGTMDEVFPGIGRFGRRVIKVGEDNFLKNGSSFVKLRSGRKFTVDPGHEYKLVNYVVQGTAAEELKRAIIRLDAAGMSQYIHLPVHDELLFSFPKDEALELQEAAMELMRDRDTYRVPLEVEAGTLAENWADSK